MGDADWYQGDSLRIYYAYRPNEYADNNNWLQAVLIFPFSGVPNIAAYAGAIAYPFAHTG